MANLQYSAVLIMRVMLGWRQADQFGNTRPPFYPNLGPSSLKATSIILHRPGDNTDYTTRLVILHGHNLHRGGPHILGRIPLTAGYNTLLILVNRHDYPGSTLYTSSEGTMVPTFNPTQTKRCQLKPATPSTNSCEIAREVFDFLEGLVRGSDDIPPAQPNTKSGIIIVAGWSLGAL
ncbi:hypothetical protein V8D89_006298 [Ganoderma adspersum]